MRAAVRLSWFVALVGVAGCASGRYPVAGRVVFEDGSPLDEGMVICEMQEGERTVMARGILRRDGTFTLGTDRVGDGVRPGKYRVMVVPRGLTQAEAKVTPPILDSKFRSFETSEIELIVKEGKNELNITVSKPKGPSP